MSDNLNGGRTVYENADPEEMAWFLKQWAIWPKRAHKDFTTNGSFHYGAFCAHREKNKDTVISAEFEQHVSVMDRLSKEMLR